MPEGSESPESGTPLDTTKRYDVFCSRHNQEKTLVYRNVLFRGMVNLFGKGKFDVLSQFIELEHKNGDRVYVSRAGIIGFCEHGKSLGAELLRES